MSGEKLTGENRCWQCTIANSIAGLVVALVPLVAAIIEGNSMLLAVAVGWAAIVIGYTAYRLVDRGYLPLAEPVAKATGLHDRIGPGSKSEEKADEDDAY